MFSPFASTVLAMTMPMEAPSAPVISHFRPEMRQPLPSGRATVCMAEGSEPAPGDGSVIRKMERAEPSASGLRYCCFCASVPT